jgi:hypothetical protein
MPVDIATTLTANDTTTKSLNSNIAYTDELVLNGRSITAVKDVADVPETESIPSLKALYDLERALQQTVNLFKTQIDTMMQQMAISNAIITPYFNDDSWVTSGVYYSNNRAIYEHTPDNIKTSLLVGNKYFISTGIYFIEVVVERLDSGEINCYNELNIKVINPITGIGTYRNTILVENIDTICLEFKIENVKLQDTVIIKNIFIHYVSRQLDKFIDYKSQKYGIGGGTVYRNDFIEVSKIIPANTNITLPNDYVVGNNKLFVWQDGFKCIKGNNPLKSTFYEIGSDGGISNVIRFHDAIPVGTTLEIMIES